MHEEKLLIAAAEAEMEIHQYCQRQNYSTDKKILMYIFLNKQLFLFKRLAHLDCWW